MSYNGSGTFSLVAGNPVVTSTTISSTWANNTLSDIATGLSTAVTKDGQTTPTANIPMGGFKLTGLGAATTAGDALRFENIALLGSSIQNQTYVAFTTGGTSTAYTLTPTPAITAYTAGQSFFVNFNAASGAAPTLAISAVATPPNLVKQNVDGTYSNIAANDIPINHRSRVTLLSATQALVERLPVGGPTFSAYLSADQSLTSGVAAKILFNTEDFDTNSNFASSRFTPTVAGYYQVNSNCGLAVASGWSAGFASLYKNGAEYERGAQLNTTGVTLFGSTYTGVVAMNGSTDYIEMYAAVTGTTPIVAGNSVRISKFSATFLRGL